jgi:hypothetical protein
MSTVAGETPIFAVPNGRTTLPPMAPPRNKGFSIKKTDELTGKYVRMQSEITGIRESLPGEDIQALGLPDLIQNPGADMATTAEAIDRQLIILCVRARKKARTGGLSYDAGTAADRISRIAFSGLVTGEDGDDPVQRWRDAIAKELVGKKHVDLNEHLAKTEGETRRRTQLRHVLGAMSLRVFGDGSTEEDEAEMFHSGSYRIPVEIDTGSWTGRGPVAVEYDLHRFTDTPGADYTAVTDVINISGLGHFASYPTSISVLRSLLLRPGNEASFGERVCQSMLASINKALNGARASNNPASVWKHSQIFLGDSMGCLLLGRLAKTLDAASGILSL